MGFEIRKKESLEGAERFVERMKRMQKEAQAALKKVQEEIKKQVDKKGERQRNMKKKT